MSYTKRQFIINAFEELGLSDSNYNLQDQQLTLALKRLDSMMATWNSKGIRLSYPIPTTPEASSINDETNVPDRANEAIYTNLALRIAPSFGVMVSNELKANARMSYRDLLSSSAYPLSERQLDNVPKGAGYKSRQVNSSAFITPDLSSINVGSDGELEY